MRQFNWEISAESNESTKHNVNVVKFGDGYEQVSNHGINNKRKTWQCSRTAQKPVIDDIKAFLDSTAAIEPFYFQPLAHEPQLTVRLEGEVSRNKVGGDIWSLSFTLKQVFIP